ncbi:MAG: hypothetical protein IH788_03875 [Nitrospinae bacterium]|nr:hypothetical protein [Nitrospinota bacterium]
MTFHDFCDAISQLMCACGGRITSWGRSPFGNDEVGGVITSYHTLMMAVDWTWSEAELAATTVSDKRGGQGSASGGRPMSGRQRMMILAPRCGLEVLDEGSHLHIEPSKKED